jgi:hypothetical protein
MGTTLRRESWTALLGADPRAWLLTCDEPAARWVTLTELLDRPRDDPARAAAHADVLADPGTRELLERLPDWQTDNHSVRPRTSRGVWPPRRDDSPVVRYERASSVHIRRPDCPEVVERTEKDE